MTKSITRKVNGVAEDEALLKESKMVLDSNRHSSVSEFLSKRCVSALKTNS